MADKQVNVYFTQEQWEALRKLAKSRGLSVSAFLRSMAVAECAEAGL